MQPESTAKPVALLIPGMACTSAIWDGLEVLPYHFDCHLMDWPKNPEELKTLEDCAHFVANKAHEIGAELVIGHSLGGLATLKALEQNWLQIPCSVVIESFLEVPPEFFRQFVGPYASAELEAKLHEMFNENRSSFHEELKTFVKEKITRKCINLKKIQNTFFIYGMRAQEDEEKVLDLLPYLADLDDSNSIGLVPFSAHFPMIEEPQELEEAICEFLEDIP